MHQHDDGKLTCTCKEYRANMPCGDCGWSTARRGSGCRHIRAYREELKQPGPFESLDWL